MWTPEEINELIAFYQQGFGYIKCAQKFNSTKDVVRGILKRAGVADPARTSSKGLDTTIVELWLIWCQGALPSRPLAKC